MDKRPKATDKKSFILYNDLQPMLDKLTVEQAGKLFKAIYQYQNDGTLAKLDAVTDMALTSIVTHFKRDDAKWGRTRISRSEAGRKGGLAKQANAKLAKQNKQSLANQASLAVSVSVSDSVSEINKGKYGEDFSRFWQAYPKKKAKGTAYKSWNKLKKVLPPIDDLIKIVDDHKRSTDWKKENGQFVPYPASWLNAKQWEDEEGETGVPEYQFVEDATRWDGERLCRGLTRAQHLAKYGRVS